MHNYLTKQKNSIEQPNKSYNCKCNIEIKYFPHFIQRTKPQKKENDKLINN